MKEQHHTSEISEFAQQLHQFFDEREWDKFHSPKNMVMNLGVEVGELTEHFRWISESASYLKEPSPVLEEVKDEIGDVFITLVHLSQLLGIDPLKAAKDKLTKIGQKYPAEICRGRCDKYTVYEKQSHQLK